MENQKTLRIQNICYDIINAESVCKGSMHVFITSVSLLYRQ